MYICTMSSSLSSKKWNSTEKQNNRRGYFTEGFQYSAQFCGIWESPEKRENLESAEQITKQTGTRDEFACNLRRCTILKV